MSNRKFILKWNVLFFLYSLGLFWGVGLLFFNFNQMLQFDIVNLTFLIASLLGHMAIFPFIITLVACVITILLPYKKVILPLVCILYATTLVLLVGDSFVYGIYHSHLNLLYFQMILLAGSEIFHFSLIEWVITILVSSGFLAILTSFAWIINRKLTTQKQIHFSTMGFLVPFIALISSHSIYLYADATYNTKILSTAEKLPHYYGMTAKRLLAQYNIVSPSDHFLAEKITIDTSDNPLNYPKKPLTFKGPNKPYNILIIAIDQWRFDMLNKDVTPHIYEFAEQNQRFLNHYSGGNCTSAGIFTLFSSIPNNYWRAFYQNSINPALIQTLQHHNYELQFFASAPLSSPAFHRMLFSNVDNLQVNTKGDTVIERDENITKSIIKLINNQTEQSKPFFSFVFYDAAHAYEFPSNYTLKFTPYLNSVNHFSLTNNYDPTEYFNRYKNSLHYVDSLVQKVLQALKDKALLESTIVIITSDHGEEFNDNKHNYWGHNSNFTPFQTKTPMIVHWPGETPKTYSHTTTHYDVVPTLLTSYFNCNNEISDYSIGKILTDSTERDLVLFSSYSNTAFMIGDKLITIEATGNVKVTDIYANPVENDAFPVKTLQKALKVMRQFYK